ncbi:MAG: hypothetical protein H6883_06150 [Rhodobiaceae bacterium]|nr:hypothetical protein [Rhodobiaceae bacterium]MCC0055700.1 hypothetical protein [Rhodobiaceae bacterium]
MSKDLIRYDILAQEALLGMVRRVLSDTTRAGLPGEHHFYIAFDTRAPGVRLSQRLRDEHPEEMTIVIQHQYWDLKVSDTDFEVSLSFNGVPEHLRIPFAAIRGFYDPSVSFGLQFDQQDLAAHRAKKADGIGTRPDEKIEDALPAELIPAGAEGSKDEKPKARKDDAGDGAEVVSLDSFRKKN